MKREPRYLSQRKVRRMVMDLLQHIVQEWDFYKNHLPHLRRTLMVYNEFANAIHFLPEERRGCGISFNPKDPLLDDIPSLFGAAFTANIGNLIYGAWPLRVDGQVWKGYKEPSPDTPESVYRRNPDLFKTIEDARTYMYEIPGTGFADYEGKRVLMSIGGTPEIWYRGFTRVKESPAQKRALDALRLHPRILLGLQKMEAAYEQSRRAHLQRQRGYAKLATLSRTNNPEGIRRQMEKLREYH